VFALATNAVIHALKGTGAVRQRLQAMDANDLAAPAIVVYELEFGALASNASQRRKDLARLLGVLHVLPFDEKAANRAARLRRDLEQAGIKIGPLDTLIAGTALVHNAVLVSHNIREFSRVQGLQVEDWL
jgi:tRNA(fMet)-specific endonuclease VapC